MANRNYVNFFNTIGEENDIFEQFGSSNNPSYLPTDSSTHDFSSFTIPNLDSPNISTPIGPTPSSSTAQDVNNPVGKRSSVWQNFTKINVTENNGQIKKKAVCNICNAILSAEPNDGTSHLKRHIKNRHNNAQVDIRTQMNLGGGTSGNLSTWQYDESRARQELVDFMVRAEQPFTFVEKHDFIGTIQRSFNPQFKGFSASTARRDSLKGFQKSKKMLFQFFSSYEGKICLTTDMWSKANISYMGITAHFIDNDWNLNKKIISFKMLELPHDGNTIGDALVNELREWGIEKKIFSISLDNATNNDVAERYLKVFLAPPLDGKLFRIRCCAHILNLIVQVGLQQLAPSISRIRNVVLNINSNPSKWQLYKECCEMVGDKKRNVPIDVPHRWNATYLLLKAAVKQKNSLDCYCRELIRNSTSRRPPGLEPPTESDWIVAKLVMDFLKIFDISTKIFCGIYYPTISRVIIQLCNITLKMNSYDCIDIFTPVLEVMRAKFNKYWEYIPIIYGIGVVMDPRYKIDSLRIWLIEILYPNDPERVNIWLEDVRQTLFDLYEYYKNLVGESRPHATQSVRSSTSSSSGFGALSILKSRRLQNATSSSTPSPGFSELQRYLDHPPIDVDEENETDFNLLGWWKQQEPRYSVLSVMARDILSVPVSTVASESAFSTSGRIISPSRASLNPESLELLICKKDWELADKRQQEHARMAELEEQMQELELSKPTWIDAEHYPSDEE